MARDRRDLDGIEAELADYDEVDDEELSEEEKATKLNLSRRCRNARQVGLQLRHAVR